MRRGLGISGLLSVAAFAMLVGHAVTYLLEGRTLADGRHGYFAPLLEIVFASVALSCVVLIVRAMRAREGDRVSETPSLPVLWMTLATLQVVGFAALESLEGNAPDAAGWGVEVIVALIVAVGVALFLGFVERCILAIATTYLGRERNHRSTTGLRAAGVRSPLQLAVCAGVHRFKRPPPIVIG
jgi:hypothetical protein